MNDAKSASSVEPVSATSPPAGLPAPTNTGTQSDSQSLTSAEEHLRLGELELEQGNYAQAQMHFDHVLQKHPDHVKANHRLGVLSDKLGQYLRAEEHYLTALNGDPRNAALLSDLGYSYWLQRRYSESEKYLLEARKLDPNYDKAIANLGLLYGSTGRREEALAMFTQIGDDAEVRQIMQQIAAGQFQSPQQPADDQFAPQQQSSVVTTQSTAQHAAQARPQDMNEATREFVEQMRLARDELRRAEERLARQQAQGTAMAQPQTGFGPAGGQPPASWAEHAAASRIDQRPQPQSAGVTPFSDQDQYAQQAIRNEQLPDAALAERMAAIDRRDQHSPTGRPLVIGASASTAAVTSNQPVTEGRPTDSDNFSPQSSFVNQPPNQSLAEASSAGGGVPQYWPAPGNQPPQSSWWDHADQNQAPPTGSMPAQQYDSSPAPPPQSAWGQQYVTAPGQPSAHQHASAGSPTGVTPSSPIQQASASGPRYAQRPVEHAYHTQSSGQQPDISLAGETNAPTNSLVPPSLNGNRSLQPHPGDSTSSGNLQPPVSARSYEQARREAAMVGLGAGPGQVFPYIRQTPRAMPGTDSRLNGAQDPAPMRHIPTGRTTPAPNSGYPAPAPTNFAPTHNDWGEPMPPVRIRTRSPDANNSFGSGSFQQHQPMEQSATRDPSSTTPHMDTQYQNPRVQQADQLNGFNNQTWGQPPQPPHDGLAPPTTRQYAPATGNPVPAAAVVVPRSPGNGFSARAEGGVSHSPDGGSHAQSASSLNRDATVVPQPYRSDQNATTYGQVPNTQTQTSRAADARPYEGPVIVPARR